MPRKGRAKAGKAVIDVVQVQEFVGGGPIVVAMAPAMRHVLVELLRKSGNKPDGGSVCGVVVAEIPAHPFTQPALKQFEKGAQKRFPGRVVGLMGMAAGPTLDKESGMS